MQKYISKYSNGKSVSAAQYITEIICEHLAKKDKKDLHYRFWLNKEWASFYKSQIFTANKLLKTYSPKAIINALKTTKAQKIYSLRAPHLVAIIQQEQEKLEKQKDEKVIDIKRVENSAGQQKIKSKNILDLIKEIDNEH
jgi:hypothetical protein